MSKVTKSLVRNRSHSEDAFFKGKDRMKSMERGVLHRGLIGAEGTAPPQGGDSEEREVFMTKENSTRRLRGSRFGNKAASFCEGQDAPPSNLSMHYATA